MGFYDQYLGCLAMPGYLTGRVPPDSIPRPRMSSHPLLRDDDGNRNSGPSSGAIVGSVIANIVFWGLVFYCICKRRQERQERANRRQAPGPPRVVYVQGPSPQYAALPAEPGYQDGRMLGYPPSAPMAGYPVASAPPAGHPGPAVPPQAVPAPYQPSLPASTAYRPPQAPASGASARHARFDALISELMLADSTPAIRSALSGLQTLAGYPDTLPTDAKVQVREAGRSVLTRAAALWTTDVAEAFGVLLGSLDT